MEGGGGTTRLVSVVASRVGCFGFRIEVCVNQLENLVKYGCRFLRNDCLLVISSQELRINFMHKLLRRRGEEQCLVRVSQETGEVELCLLANYSSLIMNNLKCLGKEITEKLKELLQLAPKYLRTILHEINDPRGLPEHAAAKASNL